MITVRQMRTEDARAFLEIHHAAVRGIAAADYPSPVIEAWAPLPITDRTLEGFLANPDREIRLVAEIDGEIVGVGALVPSKAELRACYVAPERPAEASARPWCASSSGSHISTASPSWSWTRR
jgi:putative acetyltransferase